MALLGSEKNAVPSSQQDRADVFALACHLYRNGAYAQSHRLLASMEKEWADAASFFVNSALCHMQAEEWQTALVRLEKALSLLKQQAAAEPAYVPDATYNRLALTQAENDAYLCPMPLTLPAMLPDYAKQCVLRLMIDVCVKLALWERVVQLGEPLRAKGYCNVDKALEQAKEVV